MERYIEKMNIEHQKKIAKLEARQPSTPPAERKPHALELKVAVEKIEVQVTACQTLLEQTTVMWAGMEDIPTIVDTR